MERCPIKPAVALAALCLALTVAGCGGEGGKFRGQDIQLGDGGAYSLAKREAACVRFEGAPAELDLAVGKLYRWIRQRGRFFGGAPVLLLDRWPDFKGEARLAGRLFFPLMPGTGKVEYADQRLDIEPAITNLPAGDYYSVAYRGRVEFVEAGFERLRSLLDRRGMLGAVKPAIVFEDTFLDLEKKRQLRVMASTAADK